MMKNLSGKKDQLLSLMRRPTAPKKPSNFALWWAWLFYNIVALFLDIITAITVFALTNALYAVLTFFAGFGPLIMHEFLYLRAYASKTQRGIAIAGAITSVLAIITIGLLAAGVNVFADSFGDEYGMWIEFSILMLIVLNSAWHGILAAIYFYIDEGIRAKHNQAEAVAYHNTQLQNINLALSLAEKVAEAAEKEDEFVTRFGDRALLDEAMGQVTGDPNAMSQKRNLPAQAYDPNLHPPKTAILPPQMMTIPQDAQKPDEPAPVVIKAPEPVGFSGNGNGHKPVYPT